MVPDIHGSHAISWIFSKPMISSLEFQKSVSLAPKRNLIVFSGRCSSHSGTLLSYRGPDIQKFISNGLADQAAEAQTHVAPATAPTMVNRRTPRHMSPLLPPPAALTVPRPVVRVKGSLSPPNRPPQPGQWRGPPPPPYRHAGHAGQGRSARSAAVAAIARVPPRQSRLPGRSAP